VLLAAVAVFAGYESALRSVNANFINLYGCFPAQNRSRHPEEKHG
jgi:hypothetical protein